MKKLGKFLFASLSVATVAGGAYYLTKNILNKDSDDEFDEFENDFDDFDFDEDSDTTSTSSKEERGYVTISFPDEEKETSVDEVTNEAVSTEDASTEAGVDEAFSVDITEEQIKEPIEEPEETVEEMKEPTISFSVDIEEPTINFSEEITETITKPTTETPVVEREEVFPTDSF